EMLLHLGLTLGWNFANVAIIDTAGAIEHDKRARHTLQIPRLNGNVVQILDEKTCDQRNLLLGLPLFVGIDPFVFDRRRRLRHFRHKESPCKSKIKYQWCPIASRESRQPDKKI